MKLDKIFFAKRILPVAAGAAIGYAYYYFIGCYNGQCPISGNPYIATLYGAVVGAVLAFPGFNKKSKKVEDEKSNNKGN